MRIFIVRHGETEANRSRVIQGHGQNPLSEIGRQQVRALADRLLDEPIEICFSSDLRRARETAEILVERKRLSIRYCSELRERCYGEFEGRPVTDYERSLESSGMCRADFRPVGGENYHDMQKRSSNFFSTVFENHSDSTILIVGHSGINQALMRHLFEMDAEESLEQNNACLNVIDFSKIAGVQPVMLNCTAHLTSSGLQHVPSYG